jgi:hypothetical protein
VAYLISKQYGQFLVNKIFNNNDIDYSKLNDWHKPSKNSKAIAEGVIYQSKYSYSIPLVVYNTDFESNVHQSHVRSVHIPAKEKIISYWKNYSTHTGF